MTLYWLDFDGDDYITLPSGEGDEPTTGIFIEAWVQWDSLDNAERCIVNRGSAYNNGYCAAFAPIASSNNLRMRFYLKGPSGSNQYQHSETAFDDDLPTHLAYGWDGSYMYLFVNGTLINRIASDDTNISYTGDDWFLGKLATNTWYMVDFLGQVRIQSTCTHTSSFTPDTTFSADANTIALYPMSEGAGTSIDDGSTGDHDGTFKGAGEPAWGAESDLSYLHHGDALWTECINRVPPVTDTNVYVHRTDADNYEVYRKVHATGPYWAKMTMHRVASVALNLREAYTGIPDPANNDPTTWTTDPDTQHLDDDGDNEYAFYIDHDGLGYDWYGNLHGNETLESEQWYVDGDAWNPGNDEWDNGSTIRYHAETTIDDGATEIATISKDVYWYKAQMYMEAQVTVTWSKTVTAIGQAYPCMGDLTHANQDKIKFQSGGTAYNTSGASSEVGRIRSNCFAAWDADGATITAGYVTNWATGLLGQARGDRAFVNQQNSKAYISRSQEVYAPSAGTWSWTSRWLFLDNAACFLIPVTVTSTATLTETASVVVVDTECE